jgi:protein TIF31
LKDANGVKILHKLDIDGASLLGHTVVDWQGERWVCQSIMPGIFTRRKDDEDWVKVENETEAAPEKTENQLITYGLDSEDNGTIHWDEASHRLMAKVGDAHRLAAHKVKDAKGQEFEFYAGAEVKALKGTDGRRYLLDLPRLSPVDVEWLENSMESYPHRVVLLRPELLELFWESELKRYAKSFTKDDEEEKMDPVALGEKLKDFELKFNPDAFVDYPGKDGQVFTPSTITDESEPSIKAVRDASQFLQTVAIPAVVFDCMTGNLTNVIDGQSLTRHLHSRGINMRYLGKLHENILKFAKGDDAESAHTGHLAALSNLIVHEAIYRGSKHVLRKLVAGLSPELVPNAVSHFLNCLFGTEYNSKPTAVYEPLFENETRPAYVSLTATDLHAQIAKEIENRYKLTLESTPALKISRPKQLLREIATRFAFQIKQRDYVFEKTEKTTRATIFEPSDILTLVPVVRSTAPSVTIAEEVFEAGRTAIARGNMDLGLDIMAEAVGMYENIHSVIHPEVAGAYNAFASAMHQGARMRIQQLSQEEGHDPEQPLNVDVSSAVRLQRQAIIISERTRGVYDATTLSYYFNLAMLENLEGNTIASLRYFKHCLMLWDVIHGPDHPEINTILVRYPPF